MAVREPIYVALWNLLINHPSVQGQFPTNGRYKKHFDEVSVDAMPALFQTENGEQWVRAGKGIPAKRTFQAMWCMYIAAMQPNSVLPSTMINNLLDTVDEIVETPGNPSNAQTLGGLVEHVYVEGEIEIYEPFLQEKGIVLIPLTILVP